jgi:branched-chain amino acid transport system substrate-binding protein
MYSALIMKKITKGTQDVFLTFLKSFRNVTFLVLLVLWSTISLAANIKMGEINPLTGRFAKQGLETHQGIAVAVAEANEAGGIGGRMLQLFSRDDQSLPDVAISRAEELCARKEVLALTGGYVDALVGPISEVARKYKIPYVASASLQKELVQRDNAYFFRVSRLQGFVEPVCGLIAERFKPQRLAIIYSATPGSTELARDLERCLGARGCSVSLKEKFRPGTPDFTPLIGKLAGMKIDVIVSGGFSPDHILLVRQLKENRMTPKAYIGPFGIAYESFIREMGEDANFLYSTCAWDPSFTLPGTEAASKEFIQRFRRMFNQAPNTTNMHGYISARSLIEAMHTVLRRGQSLTGAHIRNALADQNLILPMERLAFDQRGDPRHYRHVIVQIQSGKLEVVYPPDRATSAAIYPMPTWDQRR